MFSYDINPRFCDTDALGHINNTKVPIWFEGARDPVFQWFTPDLNPNKWQLILAKISVDFHAQMYYGKDMMVKTYISRIGSSSFDVYQELWQDQIKCASGKAIMVHFCFEKQKPSPIPDHIKQQMQQHLFQEQS